MPECPEPLELQKLLADANPGPELNQLARHLETCNTCRANLELLSGLRELLPEGETTLNPRAAPTEALVSAIRELERRGEPSSETSFSPSTVNVGLSFLQPPSQPGCIGRLGRFDVLRVLGQGGMGIVLAASDPQLQRIVAIKVLAPWMLASPAAKDRFWREAQAAARLVHENVVTIHGVDEERDVPFLVLEYVEGESLAERLERSGKLTFDECVRIGVEVSRGLAAAHSKGLIHRDIKPANILLVAESGRAKLADFGLAKDPCQQSFTHSGTMIGTPEYMSPEQAREEPGDVYSDLFSLGVVLYQMVSGISPFRGASLHETLDNVRRCQPRPLREYDANLPEWYCQIVHRLLAKEPSDRPDSAQEIAECLASSAVPDGGAPRTGPPAKQLPAGSPSVVATGRRRWLGISVAGAALLLAIVAGNSMLHPTIPRTNSTEKPIDDIDVATASIVGFTILGREEVIDSLREAIAASRDGDVIEVTGNGPFRTPPLLINGKRLTIRAARGSQPVFLTETDDRGAPGSFLRTNHDLRLEGLEIHWSIEAPIGISEGEILARSIIVATRGRLILAHCRVVGDHLINGVGATCREVLLYHCHVNPHQGLGVSWRPQPAGSLDMEGCMFGGQTGIVLLFDETSSELDSGQMRLSQTTIASSQSITLLIDQTPEQPLKISVDHSLIDGESLFFMIGRRMARPRTLFATENLPKTLRTCVTWSEQDIIYRRGIQFLVRGTPLREEAVAAADINSLASWHRLWSLKSDQSTSIEGSIRFQPPQDSNSLAPLVLAGIDDASGPLPSSGTGASIELLGPGPAYDAWRHSANYAAWPQSSDRP